MVGRGENAIALYRMITFYYHSKATGRFPKRVWLILSVNFYAVGLPGRVKATVVDHLAVPKIHGGNPFHLPVAQRKIKNISIFLHSFFMDGFGSGGDSPLSVPAQDHLHGGFSVFFRDCDQRFVWKDVF